MKALSIRNTSYRDYFLIHAPKEPDIEAIKAFDFKPEVAKIKKHRKKGENGMKRSKKVIFVPFCLLAQGFRAEGIVKKFPAIVKPVVDLLEGYQINLIQMPCPELEYEGIKRKPASKAKYDNETYRNICKKYANQMTSFIKELIGNGYEVLCILGIENSPSCAVSYLFEKGRRVRGTGVYMEELKKKLEEEKIDIQFLGVDIYGMNKTIFELRKILGDKEGLLKYTKE